MTDNKAQLTAAETRPGDRISRRGGRAAKARHAETPLLLRLLGGTMLAMGAALFMGSPTDAQAQQTIQVSGAKRTAMVNVFVGKSQDVRTDASFADVVVGDPDIADVNPMTDKQLSILGRKTGTTRVTVYGEGKRLVGIFDVEVGYDTTMLAAELNRRFPNSGLRVTSVHGKIMLTGTAHDAATLDKAMQVARQFGPEVINSVQVSQPQQVMLEVRFIEASRNASRELGVQWDVFGRRSTANIGSGRPAGLLPKVDGALGAAGVLSGAAPFGFMISRLITGGANVDLIINALEEKGLARSLAEPNLVALSGDTASFLAGGEFPIPVAAQFGTVTVDYKKYGVGLAFTPTVLSGGLINLKIEPEVSQLDTGKTINVAGVNIPPLTVRRASTTVELRDGQSFVIGGLLQSVSATDQQQLPWLGDVPVLGALFRSASYNKQETDLAIIVTPRIVVPARPGDPIKTPLDNAVAANDVDFFLMGKNEVSRTDARREVGAERAFVGHILDLPKGVAHVSVRN